jgi:hypothetical protein
MAQGTLEERVAYLEGKVEEHSWGYADDTQESTSRGHCRHCSIVAEGLSQERQHGRTVQNWQAR